MNNKPLESEGFKLTMQIAKSYSQGEGETAKMYIGGVASGLGVDRQNDRVAVTAVEAFKKAIDEGIVLPNGKWSHLPLRSGHRTEWDDVLGWITKAETDHEHNLWIEAELDETNPIAKSLFEKLQLGDRPGKPLMLGLSVGGKITKASFEWNHELNKKVRVIEGAILKEISVVGWPANPSAYVEALVKSVNWDELEASSETKESSMNELGKAADVETQAEDSEKITKANEVSSVTEETLAKATEQFDNKINSLVDQIATLAKAVEALSTSKETTQDITKADTTAVDDLAKAVNGIDSKVSTALEAAVSKLTSDVLEPLAKKVEIIGKAVVEIAEQPLDKSFAVRRAKEQGSALEDFAKNLTEKAKNHGQVDIIGEAVRAAARP